MNSRVKLKIFAATMVALTMAQSHLFAADKLASAPRLVVNIVIGSMRATDLKRYSDNFSVGGFNRLCLEGVECQAAAYSYSAGATVTSLATIATGALPSTHGVIGESWYEKSSGKLQDLTFNKEVKSLPLDIAGGGASPRKLVAETLTEALREQKRESKSFTVALNAPSAVVMNGRGGDVIWVDPRTSEWASSTAYMSHLPEWVQKANKMGVVPQIWLPSEGKSFKNRRDFGLTDGIKPIEPKGMTKQAAANAAAYDYLAYTPAGNSALLDMAWSAVQNLSLGSDEVTDILNISLDSSRNVIAQYGVESKEVEDMYYRLDRDLGRFIDNVRGWVKYRDVLFVVTSAGGSSPAYDAESRDGAEISEGYKIFNGEQFGVILNTFLGSKYGTGEWVLGYKNRSIYLNHNLTYKRKLSLEQLQNEVAEFALQFRGVSHAITASAMRGSYFGDGYASLLQRSFYPRRTGDVVVSLMSGWIEEREEARSTAGSIYRYDRDVPLLIMGSGVDNIDLARPVRMIDIAPTVARIIGVITPMSSEGEAIKEIVDSAAGVVGLVY